jgi:hypothetical protein
MTQQNTNYDDVKQYRLDPDREQELVNCAGECTFCWANKGGPPVGCDHSLRSCGREDLDDSDP